MKLEALVSAVRAAGDRDDDGSATRLRLRRSLETRGRRRRQLVSLAGALAVLLGGTLSWALATGGLTTWWSRLSHTPAHHAPIEPAAPAVPAPQRAVTPEVHPLSTWTPIPDPPPVVRPRPARPAAIAPAPVELLYRKAHELHFHGTDLAAALAAWDVYLAAEPAGRFSVEARYNRALCLVRLARYADARTALVPFARGAVEPADYRRVEASALVDRLDWLIRLNDPPAGGDPQR